MQFTILHLCAAFNCLEKASMRKLPLAETNFNLFSASSFNGT